MLLRKQKQSDGKLHFCGTTYSSDEVEILLNSNEEDELIDKILVTTKDGKTYSAEFFLDDSGNITRTTINTDKNERRIRTYYMEDQSSNTLETEELERGKGVMYYNEHWTLDSLTISKHYYVYEADSGLFGYDTVGVIPPTGIAEFKLVDRFERMYEQIKSQYQPGDTFIECDDILFTKPIDGTKRITPTNPKVSQNSFNIQLNNAPGTNQISVQVLPAIKDKPSFVTEHGHFTSANSSHPDYWKYNENPDSELYVDLMQLIRIQENSVPDLDPEDKKRLQGEFNSLFEVAGGNSPTNVLVHEIKPSGSETQVILSVKANNGNKPEDSYWKKLAEGDCIGFWKDLGINVSREGDRLCIEKGAETATVNTITNELRYASPWGNEYLNLNNALGPTPKDAYDDPDLV